MEITIQKIIREHTLLEREAGPEAWHPKKRTQPSPNEYERALEDPYKVTIDTYQRKVFI